MLKPTGRVVGIIKRNWRPYCGMLSKSDIKEVSEEYVTVIRSEQHFLEGKAASLPPALGLYV